MSFIKAILEEVQENDPEDVSLASGSRMPDRVALEQSVLRSGAGSFSISSEKTGNTYHYTFRSLGPDIWYVSVVKKGYVGLFLELESGKITFQSTTSSVMSDKAPELKALVFALSNPRHRSLTVTWGV
jgi:hypothetical protein